MAEIGIDVVGDELPGPLKVLTVNILSMFSIDSDGFDDGGGRNVVPNVEEGFTFMDIVLHDRISVVVDAKSSVGGGGLALADL